MSKELPALGWQGVETRSGNRYNLLARLSMRGNLAEFVSQLSPEEQTAVRRFIEFIRHKKGKLGETSFLAAVEEFIAAHPELLRRLAE